MNNLIFIHGANSAITDASYLEYLQEDYAPGITQPWEDLPKRDHRIPIARKWVQE